ncbi:MAG TPA: FAD-dependent oxidoreductase, partial [bacterium]|nr:FAD-dependent oxidoreductase [bacterium]
MVASPPPADCLIIGGGLGGLTAALHLARQGWRPILLERGAWPRHRVCGEYVSNEVIPYLQSLGADPAALQPARISRLLISAPSGQTLSAPLDLGGFGVSRYALDAFLARQATAAGVDCRPNTPVLDFTFDPHLDLFRVTLAGGQVLTARVVIGAFGKRSSLDRTLNRRFFTARSPWLAVKQHLRGHP